MARPCSTRFYPGLPRLSCKLKTRIAGRIVETVCRTRVTVLEQSIGELELCNLPIPAISVRGYGLGRQYRYETLECIATSAKTCVGVVQQLWPTILGSTNLVPTDFVCTDTEVYVLLKERQDLRGRSDLQDVDPESSG